MTRDRPRNNGHGQTAGPITCSAADLARTIPPFLSFHCALISAYQRHRPLRRPCRKKRNRPFQGRIICRGRVSAGSSTAVKRGSACSPARSLVSGAMGRRLAEAWRTWCAGGRSRALTDVRKAAGRTEGLGPQVAPATRLLCFLQLDSSGNRSGSTKRREAAFFR